MAGFEKRESEAAEDLPENGRKARLERRRILRFLMPDSVQTDHLDAGQGALVRWSVKRRSLPECLSIKHPKLSERMLVTLGKSWAQVANNPWCCGFPRWNCAMKRATGSKGERHVPKTNRQKISLRGWRYCRSGGGELSQGKRCNPDQPPSPTSANNRAATSREAA